MLLMLVFGILSPLQFTVWTVKFYSTPVTNSQMIKTD